MERGQNIEDEFMEAQKKRLESGYDLEEEEAKIFPVTEILKRSIVTVVSDSMHWR